MHSVLRLDGGMQNFVKMLTCKAVTLHSVLCLGGGMQIFVKMFTGKVGTLTVGTCSCFPLPRRGRVFLHDLVARL